MNNESIKLGISFSADTVRFIEAEEWNGKYNITNVVQTPLPKSFDFSIIGDQEFVPRIADLIDKTVDNFSSDISNTRVCIDRRLALKKNFAIDKGLSDKEVQDHIEWELDQVLVAPRDEYNVDFVHTSLVSARKDAVVFAAIRKAIVKYLQDIFKKSRLSLEMLDLDLFASIRALNAAYPDDLQGAAALVEFAQSGIGITFLIDGRYVFSTDIITLANGQRFDALSVDELASTIHEELQKLTENVEENFQATDLNRIYLAGTLQHKSIIDELLKLRPLVQIELAEPFRQAHKQLNIESQMLIDERGEQFMSCLGMIL